jgi:hypothetical protein
MVRCDVRDDAADLASAERNRYETPHPDIELGGNEVIERLVHPPRRDQRDNCGDGDRISR